MNLKDEDISLEFTINLKLLKEVELTPTWFSFLMCCHNNIPYPCANEVVQKEMGILLEKKGWCKIGVEGIIPRQKFINLIEAEDSSPANVSSWVEDWRELFPKGVKSAGRPIRGEKQGVLKKMQTFCKQHPKYTKSQIFEATEQYLFEKKLEYYKYTICADYFISKNGVSMLAACIEDLEDKEKILKNKKQEGGSIWHKEV